MKQFLATIFIFILPVYGMSQNRKIDSLDLLIKNAASDTTRVNLLNQKSVALNNVDLNAAIENSKKTIAEAIRINYKKGEAAARVRMANSLSFKGEYPLAVTQLKSAEQLAQSLDDSLVYLSVYMAYGMMHGIQSNYDSSIQFFEKSLGIAERNNYENDMATLYNNMAISYQMLGLIPKSLLFQQKALGIAEKQNNDVTRAYSHLNIGITYKVMKDYDRSNQNLTKGIELARKSGLKNVELYGYSNLASLNEAMKNLENAYKYALKSTELAKETGDLGIESAGYSIAASSLAGLERFEEAEKLAFKSLATAEKSKQPLNIFQANSTLGRVLMFQKRHKDAIVYFENAFVAMKDADMYDDQVAACYSNLSKCYETTGNFEKALANFKISTQIRDSVMSKENVKKATELTMNYEFEKKEQAAFAEQKQKDAISRQQRIALIVGIGLAFLLALVSFIGYKNKQKANALLRRQKKEINRTLNKLRAAQNQLVQSEKMASLGELTAGIAHEIQNPLNFVNNFSEVSVELVQEMEEEINNGRTEDLKILTSDIKQNLEKISHHGKRAASIVKGMLQHSRTSTGVKEPANINQLTDEYLRLAYHGLRAKDKTFNATLKTSYDDDTGEAIIIPQDIGRVILNLITNAFYAVTEKKKSGLPGYEPIVSVSTRPLEGDEESDQEFVEIRIRDNGNGIPEKVLEKIFQPFYTTKPTGQGTGLGLSMSYEIVTKGHNGELKVETREEEFAEFIIVLPKNIS